jgi:hypothetical protein
MQGSAILVAMASRTTQSERLHESANGYDRIDRESGVIYGVRVLGLKSKNGREYLREAVRKATPLYEGARVYLDHKLSGDRSTRERWGKLKNVREADDGGLIADLEFLVNHQETEAILEAAEKFRDIGLSHDTLGRSRLENGKRVIYEIVEVKSVDLVENPATTENLWESQMPTIKKRAIALLRENRATSKAANSLLKRITEMSDENPDDMLAMGMDEAEVEMPAEEPLAGDDAVKAALRSAILAILDNSDDSATTMKKIKMLMDTGDKVVTPGAAPVMEEDGEEMPVEPDGDEEPKMESVLRKRIAKVDKLLERVERRERQLECRQLLESKGREVTDERLRLLAGVPEGDREALVESWERSGAKPGQSRPRYPVGGGSGSASYQQARATVRALAKK